jgi:hypothetical protein
MHVRTARFYARRLQFSQDMPPSGGAHGIEEFADLELEAVAVSGQ